MLTLENLKQQAAENQLKHEKQHQLALQREQQEKLQKAHAYLQGKRNDSQFRLNPEDYHLEVHACGQGSVMVLALAGLCLAVRFWRDEVNVVGLVQPGYHTVGDPPVTLTIKNVLDLGHHLNRYPLEEWLRPQDCIVLEVDDDLVLHGVKGEEGLLQKRAEQLLAAQRDENDLQGQKAQTLKELLSAPQAPVVVQLASNLLSQNLKLTVPEAHRRALELLECHAGHLSGEKPQPKPPTIWMRFQKWLGWAD